MKKLLVKIGYKLIARSHKMNALELQNGIALAENLGKFLHEATESKRPLQTKIVCKIGNSDVTILKLWATTDGNTPTNRVIELCDERDRLKARIAELEAKQGKQDNRTEGHC